MEQPHTESQPDPGPLTTRIVGELVPPDEPRTPAHPAPEQLEVTQPYIPAIRDETPEFARRLNPAPPAAPRPAAPAGTGLPAAHGEPAQPASAPTHPATTTPAAPETPRGSQRTTATNAAPKRRSLARRVVRRIIGPDLLRKDPAPKKR